MVNDIDNLVTTARAMSYGDQGRLAVGFSSSLTSGNLRATIADYLLRFPDVQFDGVEAEPDRLRHALQLRILDVAVSGKLGYERFLCGRSVSWLYCPKVVRWLKPSKFIGRT
jgi:DNA-binding transcriptional LysR family regulator